MANAVMTHAPTQATTVEYTALPTHIQDRFDALMGQADNVTNNEDYRLLMVVAATLVGIRLPDGGEIAKCACPNCWDCDRIFDANHPDAHPFGESDGYNLGRIQCDNCADQHRATNEQ